VNLALIVLKRNAKSDHCSIKAYKVNGGVTSHCLSSIFFRKEQHHFKIKTAEKQALALSWMKNTLMTHAFRLILPILKMKTCHRYTLISLMLAVQT